jgi:hypothetical protein
MFSAATALLALGCAAAAAPPAFRVTYLGESVQVAGINQTGDMIGNATFGLDNRAWVSLAGAPFEALPLPDGMSSSIANDINDAGEIVGAVSETYSAYDFPYAAVWRPGPNGYEVEELGRLPGHVRSMAAAINNVGDIVGDSRSGMFKYPVLFGAGGIIDLSPTGIFDPRAINDGRVLIAGSRRLDLDTMTTDDIGTPEAHYIATTGYAINERGDVAGAAISNSEHCTSTPARYTEGSGWELLASCAQYNSATGMNDGRDTTIAMAGFIALVRLEGDGTFLVDDLIDPAEGDWVILGAAEINNSRQIAAVGKNLDDGRVGAVLLTPVSPCYADFTGDGALDLFDFLSFVNAFNAEDPAADCDRNGVFDLFDCLAFVNAFNAGC